MDPKVNTVRTTVEFDGAAFRKAREDKGLSRDEAAAIVNRHPMTLQQIESGRCMPSTALLLALAAIYEADLNSFVRPKAKPKPKAKARSKRSAVRA
jgi:transcriptional regulator with XRE-family HTH domain